MMKNRLVRSLFKKNLDASSSKEMKIHFLLFTAFIKNVVNCGNILTTSTKPFAVRNLNQVISVGIPIAIRTCALDFYHNKVGYVVAMAVIPNAEYGPNDNREDALHFIQLMLPRFIRQNKFQPCRSSRGNFEFIKS